MQAHLNLSCKILLKGFQDKEIIAVDKHVTRILITERLFSVFNQYARLQPRLVILAYPGEFKFWVLVVIILYFSAFYSSFRIINNSIRLCNYYIYTIRYFLLSHSLDNKLFLLFRQFFFEDGGRKLSPVTTFCLSLLPVHALPS